MERAVKTSEGKDEEKKKLSDSSRFYRCNDSGLQETLWDQGDVAKVIAGGLVTSRAWSSW